MSVPHSDGRALSFRTANFGYFHDPFGRSGVTTSSNFSRAVRSSKFRFYVSYCCLPRKNYSSVNIDVLVLACTSPEGPVHRRRPAAFLRVLFVFAV